MCGGNLVRSPTSIKGGSAPLKGAATIAKGNFSQLGGTTYQYQGSGAKPYVIDLEGHDDRCDSPTPTCTCPNWKLERNKRLTSNGKFMGYNCKHIAEILAGGASVKKSKVDAAAKAKSEAAAQRKADEILALFKKG